MREKEIKIYSAVLIVYLVIISFLRWELNWRVLLLWLGGFVGLALYNLDHLAYLLWQAPEDSAAIEFRQLVSQRRFKEGLFLLIKTADQRKRLVGHSVIFQGVLVALTFFAVSSTASLLGKGLVMGLFLYSLINQALLLLAGHDLSSWFWQVQTRLSKTGEAFYFLILVIIFFYFSRFLI
jgi:hypothetical protein